MGRPAGDPVPTLSLGRFLRLAVWFALFAGLGEVVTLAVKKFVLHQYITASDPVSYDVVWMAPLASLFVSTVSAFIIFLARWRWPKLVSLRTATFVFAFPGLLSLLSMYPQLHGYAALLLAMGLAVSTARFFAAHTDFAFALVRRTTGWMMALVVRLAVVVQTWPVLTVTAKRRALEKLPAA